MEFRSRRLRNSFKRDRVRSSRAAGVDVRAKKIRGSGSQREAAAQRGRRPATTSKGAVEKPQQPKHNRRFIRSQALTSLFAPFLPVIYPIFPVLPILEGFSRPTHIALA